MTHPNINTDYSEALLEFITPPTENTEALLKQLDIPFETKIVSAHRTPQLLYSYAETAEARGIQIIIAALQGIELDINAALDLKQRLRTGTVVTTDDRNWELRFTDSARRFNQSRAIAIDMESATIAANGFRLRVPYGVLLCVSDKPLHGELKLPGQANLFYDRAVSEHIQIGIAAVDELRGFGTRLHSRKLRAFDEPPFR